MEHCVSESCWKEGIWQNKSSAYICEYPEGVFNQSCETKVNKCSSMPCQNYTDCNDIPNVSLNLTCKGVVLKYCFTITKLFEKYK